ncbi:hypothetical protein GCM10010429_52250 [Micromonospora olivasterospora]
MPLPSSDAERSSGNRLGVMGYDETPLGRGGPCHGRWTAGGPNGGNPCEPGAGLGILDGVFGQRYYFYYGTGSPAAVGRA